MNFWWNFRRCRTLVLSKTSIQQFQEEKKGNEQAYEWLLSILLNVGANMPLVPIINVTSLWITCQNPLIVHFY